MRDEQTLAQLQNLNRAIMLTFIAIACGLIFWSVLRAPAILAREDNPRLVDAELSIQRGRILDRKETILAETVGPAEALERQYPIAEIGPAVGYYSFRHGTTGIEENYDALLAGETGDAWERLWQQSLHQPQVGQDVQITLDAELQQMADALLGERRGAVLLLTLPEAEILALVSHPGYDPNQLDDRFEALTGDASAPLLNRATQGQYQPGLVLQPLLLAAALDQGVIELDAEVADPNRPVGLNGVVTGCASAPPEPATWIDVLIHRCPGPMIDLAGQLGPSRLDQIFADFGLTAEVPIPLASETAASEPVADVALASIGQENLTVSPLQIGLAWAALGGDGRLPAPQLVMAEQGPNGEWVGVAPEQTFLGTTVSPESARKLREAVPPRGDVVEFSIRVLSGPDEAVNSWYLGMAPAAIPRYAVVVILEGDSESEAAAEAGRRLLASVPFF